MWARRLARGARIALVVLVAAFTVAFLPSISWAVDTGTPTPTDTSTDTGTPVPTTSSVSTGTATVTETATVTVSASGTSPAPSVSSSSPAWSLAPGEDCSSTPAPYWCSLGTGETRYALVFGMGLLVFAAGALVVMQMGVLARG